MPVDETERERRRRLVADHVAAENAHDIEAIMATFAPHAIGQINGDASTTPEAIRQGHVFFGMLVSESARIEFSPIFAAGVTP